MEAMTARALIYSKLSFEERQELRMLEKRLPPGRYLEGCEISRIFKKKFGEVPAELTERVDTLWREYQQRVLWKANEIENLRHDKFCQGLGIVKWCKCRTRQEEIHEWEDWFLENGDKPEGKITWEIPRSVLSKVRS